MSYNRAYRIKDENGTKSIGEEIKLVGPGDPGFTEDALKGWANSQFLKLIGGKLTGALVLQDLTHNRSEYPEEIYGFINTLNFIDSADELIGHLGIAQYPDGMLSTYIGSWWGSYRMGINAYLNDGGENSSKSWAFCNTPPVDAPNNAIYTKEALLRDFLAKTGGEMSGPLSVLNNAINLTRNDVSRGDAPASSKWWTLGARGADTNLLGSFDVSLKANGSVESRLTALQSDESGNNSYASMGIAHDLNGTAYSFLPNPRGFHNNDGATAGWVMDNFHRDASENFYIYIDAALGSDTVDLDNGRGLSQTKPFKSLQAAINWLTARYATLKAVNFKLLSDISATNLEVNGKFIGLITFSGFQGTKIISGLSRLQITDARVTLADLSFSLSSSAVNPIQVSRSNVVVTGGIAINGACTGSTIYAYDNSYVDIAPDVNISGTVTGGKRYYAAFGSTINTRGKGANAIPGGTAGQVDGNSQYL